ncbi:eotaxin-like [Neoarius graeffei]|uniref:eotaxin-like n=1 Tax=Neoarius graeffei TaxID=443677 RepID=UPI00298C4832|nr:eotaxin-like [Neoarius graeffei]
MHRQSAQREREREREKEREKIMTVFKISTGTFVFILILSIFIVDTEPARCCLSYVRRPVRCSRLKGFSIQEITRNCDIRAIIFETWNRKFICADLKERWTQDRITCLRKTAAVLANSQPVNLG